MKRVTEPSMDLWAWVTWPVIAILATTSASMRQFRQLVSQLFLVFLLSSIVTVSAATAGYRPVLDETQDMRKEKRASHDDFLCAVRALS